MANIKIEECNELIMTACEELQALQAVMTMAEDHPVYSFDDKVLIVIRKALDAIISDIQRASDAIEIEIRKGDVSN